RRQMLFEQRAVGSGRAGETSVSQPRHDLAEHGGMIFRLGLGLDPRDAQPGKLYAPARQWTLVEEPGEIVGAIRQQLAAPDTDEEVEEFPFNLLDTRRGCGFANGGGPA